ncbi:hypothetical protein BHU72_09945 [Desulfuribacillus stibiiarsenatis]|uniref:Response regulatory domain-containing protein n=1 Tax=Desulfuribacillus stibiiarsenatis TaxID=1390249 RepID=A0A1E5L9F4_9FIRM|nr:response regulator [Desulfuribacillus stibiiarsenatis]OEH86573.1 hypothetical protein BHU72_09945 [Desulfuribacillus stibiiarsenatis]
MLLIPVEDNEQINMIYTTIFEDIVEIDCFSNPNEFYKDLKERKADIYIVDLFFGSQLLGYDICKAIREVNTEAKIIISSSYISEDNIDTLKVYGIYAFISKPFDIHNLQDVVKEIIEHSASDTKCNSN